MVFQPTHPQGVRPLIGALPSSSLMFQPTHPQGVRLGGQGDLQDIVCVSTHAPARGATAGSSRVLIGVNVSTHAPARGATSTSGYAAAYARFQPTHPQGVRRIPKDRPHRTNWFQPTHPQGVRPLCGGTGPRAAGFNPRTRKGCDHRKRTSSTRPIVFQPTHPQGVRLTQLVRVPVSDRVSTHAPARGATGHDCADVHSDGVSTHAPARGATY